MEHFRSVTIFEDDSFDCEDIIGTEDEARDAFSERWISIHNGHRFDKNPVRMELIRMEGEIDSSTSMASYEVHIGGIE